MSLDLIGLVMAIEQSFRFTIPNEGPPIRTMGDLYWVVFRQLHPYQPGGCLSSTIFYRVRQTLRDLFQVERARVTLDARLDELVPQQERRQCWHRFHEALGLPQVAPLECPPLVAWAITLTTLRVLLISLVCLLVHGFFLLSGLLAAGGILFAVVATRVTAPLAVRIPSNCSMVRTLVQELLAANYHAIMEKVGRSNPREVWDALCRVVGNNLGVDPDSLVPETNFQEDLGVD
jgi:acyl carrier protein